ncbi:hypothetical protein B0T19DRAFT_111004 [Cercophora scortea]|uniref:Uncharacterized protein n=1 Tax=Cercophora scortea TaxID=314031 RepID=A0AAE0MIX8_9PEZI|nr:hypothetical protein B0T19DRAFT_111004 [Cercophora scortea]
MESNQALLQDIVTERGVVVDSDTRTAIVSSFWPPATSIDATEPFVPPTHDLSTYFDYYTRQCQVFFSHRGTLIAARTHQDLADLVLGFLHDLDRHEIRALLAKRLQIEDDSSSSKSSSSSSSNLDPAVLDRTIDLAARLFVMVKLGEVPHSIAHSRALKWTQGTLRQFVRQQFDVPPVLSCAGVKLPKLFNARNIVRIGGIKIEWTANLADHLRMINDDEKVAVFCYPSFLVMHQNSGIFSDGFIQETLWTLKLLFPANDKGMRKWVHTQQPEMDSLVAACGNLRAELRHIEKFRYWRDRLVVLKEVFDEAEPSSLSQWWYDRRKKVQWYTWWLAVLVLLLGASFGVVQSIEGALQVFKAFNP